MPSLLLRPPSSTLAKGIVSHIKDDRHSIDYEKAYQQWNAYRDIFEKHGWKVHTVDKDDQLPDSVFVEDGIVSVDNLNKDKQDKDTKSGLLILSSPGNSAREEEIEGIRNTVKTTLPDYALTEILKPGKLDGGDILKVPLLQKIYIGSSARTNVEGIRQFTALVQPLGWQVESVPVKKALHLKSMLTALPDGSIIGYEELLEDKNVFERFISMPEPEGVAVVHLQCDPSTKETPLLISSSAPKSVEKLQELGYSIVKVDVSEFEKLEGCVTCLSVRIRHG